MKTFVERKDLTKEVLVDFLSTATYGSSYLYVRFKDRDGIEIQDDDCREEVWAKGLLNGLKIEVVDTYSEGDLYSEKGYIEKDCDCPEDEGVGVYPLGFEDIREGFCRAIDGNFKGDESEKKWVKKAALSILADDGEADLYDADAVLQVICFGELIYG